MLRDVRFRVAILILIVLPLIIGFFQFQAFYQKPLGPALNLPTRTHASKIAQRQSKQAACPKLPPSPKRPAAPQQPPRSRCAAAQR